MRQKHKKVEVLGSRVIEANWDKKKTLEQNYGAMGLSTTPLTIYTSGGVEKVLEKQAKVVAGVPSLPTRWREGVIKRKDDGTVEVVYPDSDEEEVTVEVITDEQEKPPIVKELLEQASKPTVPNIRHTSTLEGHWLQNLVDVYGDDYERMWWDRELNPMQHTAAQLKRKIKKWRETS